MSSLRHIRAGHGRSSHKSLYRLPVRRDTHFFRLRLCLWASSLDRGLLPLLPAWCWSSRHVSVWARMYQKLCTLANQNMAYVSFRHRYIRAAFFPTTPVFEISIYYYYNDKKCKSSKSFATSMKPITLCSEQHLAIS